MRDGDERYMAQETADFSGNINLSPITKKFPFWSFLIDYTQDVGTPPHMLSIIFSTIVAEAARAKNLTFVMNGQGGNQGLSFEGVSSHASLSQYRSDLRYCLGDRLSTTEFAKSLIKATYGSGRKRLKTWSGSDQKAVMKIANERTWLSHDFVKNVNGYDLLKEHYFGTDKQIEGEFKLRKQLKPGKHCRLGLWNQIGTRHDIIFIDPTRDKRFLELLVSFPNHIFNRKGDSKFLFKQAFKGNVSPKVMDYKKQGRNLADLINRYQDDLKHMDSLLKLKENDELFNEMIDPKKLRTFYEAFEGEVGYSNAKIIELTYKSTSLLQALLL